ncbi:Thymidylate synthase [Malassezia pachydermatis]
MATNEIREMHPGWDIYNDGAPNDPNDPSMPGESPQEISDRADRIVAIVRGLHSSLHKDVIVFTHGHFSKVLMSRFLRMPITFARSLVMSTSGTAVLSYAHHTYDEPALIGLFSPSLHTKLRSTVDLRPCHEEYQYLELVASVIRHGEVRQDRTGTGTIAMFGPKQSLQFDLSGGKLPLLTTKRVFFRGVLEELLWFIGGKTDSKLLSDRDIHIWDGNGSKDFLEKRGLGHRREGDLGPVYGFQWRHFGAKYIDADTDYTGQGVDQLAKVIEQIRTNPTDRRILLSAWNPADLDKMALPPCHILCQFFVSLPSEEEKAQGKKPGLSCQMYQRSCDLGLGVPFNIASYSLLTHFIAAVTGCEATTFTLVMGDAHVYLDHVEPLKQQIIREPRPFPTIHLRRAVDCIDDIQYNDVELLNYAPHGKIDMRMSV